ncbi:3-deoxy-7-phosphoheptulonate synthase [Synechococcus sp. PCC 7336]|uniref:3-deoxy-7-phosphoheptulonate synthase n=1 Tax=Synechococcus sp. PCC 7336 TaxID=195250 RepID=UPI00034D135D|nr:3-deoxy-7-phosphoheptulonate synthase [Synechococcus sp. PCC 7336]
MKDARLTRKQTPSHTSAIAITDRLAIGTEAITLIAGPCAIESREQMEAVAAHLAPSPIQMLRGGAFKPRTSPYSFQGLGRAGLEIMRDVGRAYDMPVVTEVMAVEQVEAIADCADMLQIGSRNMQNFDLLKAVGQIEKPVLLKRGLAATLEEFVMAAEYIMSSGNPNVVLCERGIRSFDTYTRNVLDLGAVVALKQLTHLPVIADPSHAAGRRELVASLSKAAIACGADGLIVECHPEPDRSVSDARQALSLDAMTALADSLPAIAAAVGRTLPATSAPLPVAV